MWQNRTTFDATFAVHGSDHPVSVGGVVAVKDELQVEFSIVATK